ncbi:MAG TPA: YqaJ viral recombinase family protein, partial [Anaeromyxobacteraceae bacterium]|nr:YqaJ viral recombinase family protein [Anaeromyxobacteraceae bacterium]
MTTKTKVSIGGSTAAAAVGLDPFRSRVQLWLELTGRVEPPDTSEAMRWGTLLEPVIAAEIDKTVEYNVLRPGQQLVDGWRHANTDGTVDDGYGPLGVLEIKTASAYRSREWADAAVPTAYVIQVSHYMALTGLTWGLVACLIGGQRLELR